MEPLAPDLWVVSRPLQLVIGDIGCRMTVVRLASGGLWLHSPVPLDEPTRRELAALGPVVAIVAPSKVHHLFVPTAAAAYPEARVYLAPGLARKRPGLAFHGVLGATPPPEWQDEIDPRLVEGMPAMNEVAFLHRASRTLVLADLAFNVQPHQVAGARLFYHLVGAVRRFGPHRIVRLAIRDRRATRRSLDAILAWDFDRVIVSHGQVLETGGREKLAAAFSFL